MGFVISLWAGSSAISAFVDSITEAHDQTPLRHPVRQRFFALGPVRGDAGGRDRRRRRSSRLGRARSPSTSRTAGTTCCEFGYYPVLFVGLVVAMNILYRVSLPKPLPSHRLLLGSVLATVVFLVATSGCGSI